MAGETKYSNCRSLCGSVLPTTQGIIYCCQPCAESAQGGWFLESHTANCRDRQKEYQRDLEARADTQWSDGNRN